MNADPVFKQTAWSTLVWNNTLPFTSPAQPVYPRAATSLPSAFVSQMDDVNSPLYLDENLPSVLLDLEGSKQGIEKWARMIGVRHEDVWSICAFTFFAICAAVIAAHALFFAFDSLLNAVGPKRKGGRGQRVGGGGGGGAADNTKPPPLRRDDTSYSAQKESINENYEGRPSDASIGRYLDSGDYEEENFVDESADYEHRPEDDFPSWRLHLALLQGNLTRVLLLFHLPLTIFSVYQFTLRSTSPTSTFALSIVVFAVVCLAWPLYQLWIIHNKPSRTLHLPPSPSLDWSTLQYLRRRMLPVPSRHYRFESHYRNRNRSGSISRNRTNSRHSTCRSRFNCLSIPLVTLGRQLGNGTSRFPPLSRSNRHRCPPRRSLPDCRHFERSRILDRLHRIPRSRIGHSATPLVTRIQILRTHHSNRRSSPLR